MKHFIDFVSEHVPAGRAVAILLVIVVLFVVAWLLSRLAARAARYFVDRSDRRRLGPGEADTAVITGLRQRETAIALISTSIRYAVFATAVILTIVALSGGQRTQAVVGASFFAIVVAFAAQRFLTDVIAGLLMFFEGWFKIGDTVAIDVWHAEGVVEAVSLRSLTIRSVRGEILHVPNSQVVALRVIPRGYREVELEFFVSALEEGRDLVAEIARIVPVDPTRFVRRPTLADTETLDENLHRITAHAGVAVGREWLADDFLPTLIRERAAPGLLVHGPIVTFVDEHASRSFARAASRSRPRLETTAPDDHWPRSIWTRH